MSGQNRIDRHLIALAREVRGLRDDVTVLILTTVDNNTALMNMLNASRNSATRLSRVEYALRDVVRVDQKIEDDFMAKRETDVQVIAEITRNTSLVASAKAAFDHYAETTADLTQKLADAIAGAQNTDDPEVVAAMEALKTNNDALKAATPEFAAAVAANTGATPSA